MHCFCNDNRNNRCADIVFGGEFLQRRRLTHHLVFCIEDSCSNTSGCCDIRCSAWFFQGLGTMMPSAVSQIIEQVVNAIVSVCHAYVLYRTGSRIGAILGDKEHYARRMASRAVHWELRSVQLRHLYLLYLYI